MTWSGSGAPGPRPLAVRTVRRPPVQRRTARQRRTDTATQSGSDRFAEVTGAVAGSRQRLRLSPRSRGLSARRGIAAGAPVTVVSHSASSTTAKGAGLKGGGTTQAPRRSARNAVIPLVTEARLPDGPSATDQTGCLWPRGPWPQPHEARDGAALRAVAAGYPPWSGGAASTADPCSWIGARRAGGCRARRRQTERASGRPPARRRRWQPRSGLSSRQRPASTPASTAGHRGGMPCS